MFDDTCRCDIMTSQIPYSFTDLDPRDLKSVLCRLAVAARSREDTVTDFGVNFTCVDVDRRFNHLAPEVGARGRGRWARSVNK
jgi:hypothetical protein